MTVAAQLQRARSDQQLSLADVTKGTKIQPWVLEALEADRLQELMSPIYVKGFLSTYAKFLHLDAEALMAQLRWPPPEELQQQTFSTPPSAPIPLTFPLPVLRWLAGAATMTVLLAGLIVLKPGRWLPKLSWSKVTSQRLASLSTAASDPLKPAPLPTLTLLASQPLELHMIAHRTTWIQLRADGKLITQQRLERGVDKRWTATKQFELIVAKPSQIELTLNGQPITPFAIAHQGHLLITHRGVTQLPDEP